MRLHAESMRAYCATHRGDGGRCGGTMGKFRLHSLSGRRDRPRASSGKMPVMRQRRHRRVACVYMRGRGRESGRMTHFSDESSTPSAKCGGELLLIHCCFRTFKCRRIKSLQKKNEDEKNGISIASKRGENLFRVNKAMYHVELEFPAISLIFTRSLYFNISLLLPFC